MYHTFSVGGREGLVALWAARRGREKERVKCFRREQTWKVHKVRKPTA